MQPLSDFDLGHVVGRPVVANFLVCPALGVPTELKTPVVAAG